eukprot:SAG11_NODE_1040_length_6065_cov_2.701307_1_plen_47_part_00
MSKMKDGEDAPDSAKSWGKHYTWPASTLQNRIRMVRLSISGLIILI